MSEKVAVPLINPDNNQIILVLGRKGSGKSVYARELFRQWPNIDKLVIDPTGDADPTLVDTVTVHKLPDKMPDPPKGRDHTVLRYVANPASATYADDLDRALALALYPKDRRTVVWVDEAGEVFPANRTGPNGMTLLRQSRHWYTSAILCNPRPMNLDPLCIAQADRVVMYDTPHPRDRERLAGTLGIPPKLLNQALDLVRAKGAYWHLVYDARSHELYLQPPLRLTKGYKHAQQ